MDQDETPKELFGVELGLFMGEVDHFHNAMGRSANRYRPSYHFSGHTAESSKQHKQPRQRPATVFNQDKEYICAICGSPILLRYQVIHEIGHTLQCFWPDCKQSGQTFDSKHHLGMHLIKEHNIRTRICKWTTHCSEVFANSGDLSRHLRAHNHIDALGLENDFLVGPIETTEQYRTTKEKKGHPMEQGKSDGGQASANENGVVIAKK